jgi:hypothetical protein
VTRDVLYATAIALGFALVLPATAGAAASQDPLKICTERYNLEKNGGSIPVGMSKSKYMSQCTGSIRRAAKLEQELQETSEQGGGNDIAATTTPVTTNKPAKVKTTTSLSLNHTPNN